MGGTVMVKEGDKERLTNFKPIGMVQNFRNYTVRVACRGHSLLVSITKVSDESLHRGKSTETSRWKNSEEYARKNSLHQSPIAFQGFQSL